MTVVQGRDRHRASGASGGSWLVELPLAVPVDRRRAAGCGGEQLGQSSSVAALLGIPQLGSLFTDGFARNFLDPIAVGILACMVLALAMDLAILWISRAVTPWLRTGAAA